MKWILRIAIVAGLGYAAYRGYRYMMIRKQIKESL